MILSFVGNLKYLSKKELRELLEYPNLNGINNIEIVAELKSRTNWNKLKE